MGAFVWFFSIDGNPDIRITPYHVKNDLCKIIEHHHGVMQTITESGSLLKPNHQLSVLYSLPENDTVLMTYANCTRSLQFPHGIVRGGTITLMYREKYVHGPLSRSFCSYRDRILQLQSDVTNVVNVYNGTVERIKL